MRVPQTYSSMNPKEQFNFNRKMFYAILAGIIVIIPIGFFLTTFFIEKPLIDDKIEKVFLIVAPILAIILFTTGILLYNNTIRSISVIATINEKMNTYRKALTFFLMFTEIPTMITAMLWLFSRNNWLIIVPIFLVVAIWYKIPTKRRLTKDLQLTLEEQQQL